LIRIKNYVGVLDGIRFLLWRLTLFITILMSTQIPTTAMPLPPPSTSNPFLIPWKCLDDSDPVKIAPQNKTKTLPFAQKTFAQVLANVCDTPSSQLPKPTLKGDKFSISIPDDEYDLGLNTCKNNLHARVIWPKGSSPLTVVALKEKLKPIWKDLAPWGVTSIGKGFYEFVFSSIEDARRVRSVSSWLLNPGYLKLFPWTKDFSPTLQTNTSAQVWMRIHGLAQEYWRKKIIFAIASSVGTPICVDSITSKPAIERTFGHFARVLVDIDLAKALKHEVLVERKGFAFFVEFEYENLPEFCDFCKLVGHNISVCRKANKTENERQSRLQTSVERTDVVDKVEGKHPVNVHQQKQKWIPIDTVVVNSEVEGEEGTGSLQKDADNRSPLNNEVTNIEKHTQGNQKISNQTPDTSDNRGLNDDNNEAFADQPVTDSDLEDHTSQASEFVDATQRLEDSNLNTSQLTPDRIQRDMHFLNDSWANLADVDEEQIRNQQAAFNDSIAAEADIDQQIETEVQNNIDNSGFHLVTRKTNRKKSQKALPPRASTTHLTKAKVPSKHLK